MPYRKHIPSPYYNLPPKKKSLYQKFKTLIRKLRRQWLIKLYGKFKKRYPIRCTICGRRAIIKYPGSYNRTSPGSAYYYPCQHRTRFKIVSM